MPALLRKKCSPPDSTARSAAVPGGLGNLSRDCPLAVGENNMPLYAERPPLPSDDKRWRIVNGTMRKHGYSRNALIETLHTVQSSFGFLDKPAIKFVAQSLRVPLSQAYGVVTFYHFFSLKPPGKHTCTICTGTACYIKGSNKLVAQAEKLLLIKPGQTTPDGEVSLTTARCVGACGRAPVTLFDGELSGQMEAAELTQQLERWTMQ
jgi:bidirectional [NiFe] hydrogenase diaphorase subunit